MWQRFKLAWRVIFKASMSRENLQEFLNLLPDKPVAKLKKNLGKSFLIEFVVKMDRPKTRKMWSW